MKKEIEKKVLLFEIIPSEFVALNCLYQERILAISTQCVRKHVLRFCISLTETFCRTTDLPLINKFGKGAVLQM